jgi:hypothetical protein
MTTRWDPVVINEGENGGFRTGCPVLTDLWSYVSNFAKRGLCYDTVEVLQIANTKQIWHAQHSPRGFHCDSSHISFPTDDPIPAPVEKVTRSPQLPVVLSTAVKDQSNRTSHHPDVTLEGRRNLRRSFKLEREKSFASTRQWSIVKLQTSPCGAGFFHRRSRMYLDLCVRFCGGESSKCSFVLKKSPSSAR